MEQFVAYQRYVGSSEKLESVLRETFRGISNFGVTVRFLSAVISQILISNITA
jgi:hypothetical protein